jgi:hypothetical protein
MMSELTKNDEAAYQEMQITFDGRDECDEVVLLRLLARRGETIAALAATLDAALSREKRLREALREAQWALECVSQEMTTGGPMSRADFWMEQAKNIEAALSTPAAPEAGEPPKAEREAGDGCIHPEPSYSHAEGRWVCSGCGSPWTSSPARGGKRGWGVSDQRYEIDGDGIRVWMRAEDVDAELARLRERVRELEREQGIKAAAREVAEKADKYEAARLEVVACMMLGQMDMLSARVSAMHDADSAVARSLSAYRQLRQESPAAEAARKKEGV